MDSKQQLFLYGGCEKNDAILHRLNQINTQQNKFDIHGGVSGGGKSSWRLVSHGWVRWATHGPTQTINGPIILGGHCIPRRRERNMDIEKAYDIKREQITVKCNNKYFIWLNQLTFRVGLVLVSADQQVECTIPQIQCTIRK